MNCQECLDYYKQTNEQPDCDDCDQCVLESIEEW